jgi:hypothetical protein
MLSMLGSLFGPPVLFSGVLGGSGVLSASSSGIGMSASFGFLAVLGAREKSDRTREVRFAASFGALVLEL